VKRRLAILNDFQRVALELADWEPVRRHFEIEVHDAMIDEAERAALLRPYAAIVAMRERTPFPAALLDRLPELRLLVTTGMWNRAIDMEAAARRGIVVCGTDSSTHAPVELTWALILGLARRIHDEDASLRRGEWQRTVGMELHGKTLAVLGLGRLGREIARIGIAFGMPVVAWSPNLTEARAEEAGARLVSREELFRSADVLTIQIVLGERTWGLVGERELGLMKRDALLVNTSRGAIVDERALASALRNGLIGGAAVDVYATEPIAPDHPLLGAPRTLLTPHIGITTRDNLRMYYEQAVEDVLAYLDGRPVRILSPTLSRHASRE
jgi:phosphoglycerate dehydrogenase-like enzyme